jgi:cytochrome c biogenesis protein
MTTVLTYARSAWRQLTAMRTALVLLFLLALAAVPGSVLPQRPLNPDKTDAYIRSHGAWGRFLDRIGAFDVFGSVWFTAVYLLLFVSLVGCLVPRIRVHARALRRAPLPAPRNLARLPESGSFTTSDAPDAYAAAARATLGRRWRVVRRDEAGGAVTLSAEKGYSRETGNLLFHVALLCALVLIAIGRLYTYQGTRVVLTGADNGFCNTILQYDSWKPGRFAAEGKVSPAPFCIDEVSSFQAKYSSAGEPEQFVAHVVYRPNVDAAPRKTTITVNHPLRLEGDRVYLIGHGYAPKLTIRMPDGTVRHDTAVFAPTDPSTYYSEGVFKEPGKEGAKQDVGIQGFFAPTPALTATGVYTSVAPQVHNPVLGLFVYVGDLNINGLPQSVYSLDTSKMKKIGAVNLHVGQTQRLPNGVTVTFDGWQPWVTLQVSHDPVQGYLLIAAVAMVVGLVGSLGVRRRRVWLRLAPARAGDAASPTVVQVGGFARSDSGNFTAEFEALLSRLRGAAAPADASEVVDPVAAGKE